MQKNVKSKDKQTFPDDLTPRIMQAPTTIQANNKERAGYVRGTPKSSNFLLLFKSS